jgi:sodium transport system permease protein
MKIMEHSARRIGVIFMKETIDNLRDRRSIFTALASTLIGPALLLVIIIIVGQSFTQDGLAASFRLPVIGAENAPSLISFLEQNGVKVVPGPANPQQAVRNGDEDVVLIIPPEYGQDFSQGLPATVQTVIDTSRQSSQPAIERIRQLLTTYSAQTASLRLLARGLSPAITQPLAVERVDMATPETQALIFLNMLPYFVVLVVFMGGMYVIIDTTAGERERNSLEPLLINPVPRWELVIGKLLASWPFAVAALFINLLAFALAINYFPLEDYLGVQIQLDVRALTGIFFISLPMIVLASALQMIIATFTRSFKEAQTYVGFLPLIPALPGIGLAFLPIKPSLWIMLIPTFGQQILINQFLRSEPISWSNVFVSALTTIAFSILLILIAIRLYSSERILGSAK